MSNNNKILDFPNIPSTGDEDIDEIESSVREAMLEEDEEKSSISLRNINLPSGLQTRVRKQYLAAILIALGTLCVCIYERQPEYLIGFLISGALVYLGISTKLDYAEGKITELAVLCVSVNVLALRKNTRVIFRTQDDIPQYFEFLVPGKHQNTFTLNFAYLIYFNPETPKQLLGYTQI